MNYDITEKWFTNEDNITYLGYGIQIHDGIIHLEIEDVSTNRLEVESYISALQERNLPLCDIPKVLEDLLHCTYAI